MLFERGEGFVSFEETFAWEAFFSLVGLTGLRRGFGEEDFFFDEDCEIPNKANIAVDPIRTAKATFIKLDRFFVFFEIFKYSWSSS